MIKMEIFEEIKSIIQNEFFGYIQEEISLEKTLGQIGLDSLDCLEFADIVETKFGVKFNNDFYPDPTISINEIIEYINKEKI